LYEVVVSRVSKDTLVNQPIAPEPSCPRFLYQGEC
jgi:hypothetical protein